MSSFDAAPLPRLGEVFFDVRGDSRSMRLSWYGDTGVAVFSIWQGGRCSGTFRLPVDDLDRMVATLRRGPDPAAEPPGFPPPDAQRLEPAEYGDRRDGERRHGDRRESDPLGGDRLAGDRREADRREADRRDSDGRDSEREYRGRAGRRARPEPDPADAAGYLASPRTGSYASDFPGAPPADPQIHPADPLGLGYQREEKAGYRDSEYSADYPGAPAYPADREYAAGREYPAPDYPSREGRDYPPADSEYPEAGYPDRAGYPESGYREPDRYAEPGYPEPRGYPEPAGYPDAGRYPEPGGYGEPGGYPDGTAYGGASYDRRSRGAGYDGDAYDGDAFDGSGFDGSGYDGSGYLESEPRRRPGPRGPRSDPRLSAGRPGAIRPA